MNLELLMIKYELEIKAIKEILGNTDRIKRIIREFDGKIYNKKFNDRLREEFPYNSDNVSITVYFNKYEHKDNECLMHIDVRNISHKTENKYGIDYIYPRNHNAETIYGFNVVDKRIIAKDWIEIVENFEVSMRNELTTLKLHNDKDFLTKLHMDKLRIMKEYTDFNRNLDTIAYDEFRIR